MNAAIRFSCMAIAVMLLALFAGTRTAMAQACAGGNITVVNHASVDIDIKVVGTNGIGTFVSPNLHLNAGSGSGSPTSGLVAIPAGIMTNGVQTVGGNNVTFIANPAPPPAKYAPHVSLNSAGGCFDVFFDAATCTIDIFMTSPTPCTP